MDSILKKYPKLYIESNLSIMSSCLAWGIECGDGWKQIIDDMSKELQQELDTWLEKNKPTRIKAVSYWFYYKMYILFNFLYKTSNQSNSFVVKNKDKYSNEKVYKTTLSILYDVTNFFLRYQDRFLLKSIPVNMPRLSQVKEKFGTLRVYMDGDDTDNIDKIIEKYEKISSVTCETCGKPGKLNTKGWCYVTCSDCRKKN